MGIVKREQDKALNNPVSRAKEYKWITDKITKNNAMILDIGCIRKDLTQISKDLLAKGHQLVGVDKQEFKGEHPKGRFQFIQGDILEIDFDDNYFDYIIATHILQHVGMPYHGGEEIDMINGDWLLMEELAKWLKPDGRLFVLVPIHPSNGATVTITASANREIRLYGQSPLFAMVFHHFFMRDYLEMDKAHYSKTHYDEAMIAIMELQKK